MDKTLIARVRIPVLKKLIAKHQKELDKHLLIIQKEKRVCLSEDN